MPVLPIKDGPVGPEGPEGPAGPPSTMNALTEFGAGVAVAEAGIEVRRGDPAYFGSRPSVLLRTGDVAVVDSCMGLFAVTGGGTGITYDQDHVFGIYECGSADNPDGSVAQRFGFTNGTGLGRFYANLQVDGSLIAKDYISLDAGQPLILGSQSTLTYETADANAHYLLLQAPGGVLIGDSTAVGKDLGLFDAATTPYLGVLDTNAVASTYLTHDSSAGNIKTTFGPLLFGPADGRCGFGGATLPKAAVHAGSGSVNQSVDCWVLVSRTADDTVPGNGHAFSDSTVVNRSGDIGYNSYDARVSVQGVHNYDHFAMFQTSPVFGTAGTIADLYGLVDSPAVNAGTITNRYGLYFTEFSGAGAVTEQCGLYVEALTKAGTNWAVKTDGATPSSFGGSVGVGGLTVEDGFLFHRQMTTAQRVAATPAEGAMVHDTDLQQLWIYLAATWKLIA